MQEERKEGDIDIEKIGKGSDINTEENGDELAECGIYSKRNNHNE